MPDRFDLSSPADLDASLRLAAHFCDVASLGSVSLDQQHHLESARTYLADQRDVVEQWLAGSLRFLGDTAIVPQPAARRMETEEELRSFGRTISETAPNTLALARRKDTVYALPPYDGQIMGADFAKHLVRVVCCATIDRGWGYAD